MNQSREHRTDTQTRSGGREGELLYSAPSAAPTVATMLFLYSFFKSPRPANILTLPAHYSCHNKFDEEYVRLILTGLGSEGSASAKELWNTKTKRSFKRSKWLQKSVRASLVPKVDLISPAGLVFDHTPGIRIETDRFYPLMRKIVQGLYVHHLGDFLSPEFRSVWNPNALLELSSDRRRLLEASRFGMVHPEVFGCRYLIQNQGTNEEWSVWWLSSTPMSSFVVMFLLVTCGRPQGTRNPNGYRPRGRAMASSPQWRHRCHLKRMSCSAAHGIP